MAKREKPQEPEEAPAEEQAAEEKPAEAAPAPAPAALPPNPRRRSNGPDKFQDTPGKKPAFVMQPLRNDPAGRMPRSRVLDPRLVPLVPPTVTTDPSRQFHALLGLPQPEGFLPDGQKPPPRRPDEPPPPPPPKPRELPAGVDRILKSLPNARAQIIKQVLTGPESRLQRALTAFIEDQRFQKLDFDSQRRALAAFDLRY